MRFFLITIILVLVSIEAHARLRDFVAIDRFTGRNLGTWSAGDGDRVWNNIGCVASSNYNDAFNDPPPVRTPAAIHEPYQYRIRDTAPTPGYFFYLDDDDSNVGNARMAATFEHRDIKVGTSFESLSDDVYDAHSHAGQFNSCNNGDNSEIQMTVLESTLENARAGQYRGRFRAEVMGGSSGTRVRGRNLVLTLSVAEIVRVSSLDNVTLGQWSGTGDMTGDETFCVYSNNDSAGYSVNFSSPNQSGGAFRLVNDSGTEFVDYELEFADSVLGAGVSVGAAAIAGNGSNVAADCAGGQNARLSVTVLEGDLGGATPDSYSDTVTILVAPL